MEVLNHIDYRDDIERIFLPGNLNGLSLLVDLNAKRLGKGENRIKVLHQGSSELYAKVLESHLRNCTRI
jgi:hypothetical protein